MQLLLDTQVVIWFLEGNIALPPSIKALITDATNDVYCSKISLFEIVIKQKVGKLSIERGLDGFIRDLAEERIELLNIDEKHLMQYDTVPLFDEHRDPFDRLILATAIAEGLPIISSDHKFSLYANLVDVIW